MKMNALNSIKLNASKHAPEIMAVAGVVSLAGTIATCIVATPKAAEIVEKAKNGYSEIEQAAEIAKDPAIDLDEEYTDQDRKRDVATTTVKAGVELAKVYLPTIVLAGVTIACFLGGQGVLKRRNAALAGLVGTLQGSIAEYRKAVAEKIGDDEELALYYGVREEVSSRRVKDEKTGKTKTVKDRDIAYTKPISPYAVIFDSTNPNWSWDPPTNMAFLASIEEVANRMLLSNGYLFLNDVYKMLGFPQTTNGQIVGWVDDGVRGLVADTMGNEPADGYVSLGLVNFANQIRDRYSHEELGIILDFNVDGVIFDCLNQINGIEE